MARKKLKLAWVENDNSRALSLKKRRVGLMKKVSELTILCGIKACMIIFSPNEVEPMTWPSIETARGLLDRFFVLPEIEQKKKETGLESYLKEKTKKIHEQLMKSLTKNREYVIDQMIVKLHRGCGISDLNLSEIYALLSFTRDKIILCRKRLDFVQYPPLRDLPVPSFEVQFQRFGTTINDAFVGGGQDDERDWKTDEAPRRISIGTLLENKSHYLLDQWFSAPESPPYSGYQQFETEMISYNENPNPRIYRPYQGSSSNGNPNLEMKLVGPQQMTFHDFVGSVSQPLQHHNMKNLPIMAMSQPRQYPFDFMSHELGVKEEGSNINNGNFHNSNNTTVTNDGVCQESPPNGTTTSEDQSELAETGSLHPSKRLC